MTRIVCQVLHRPNRVTFIWSAGTASFEPYHLQGDEVESFYDAARSARRHLARSMDSRDSQTPADLAEAGHQLYQALFRHKANDPHTREIENWLNGLRDRDEVTSLDMLGDRPGHILWNAVYDQAPPESALRSGDPAALRAFWGFRYALGVGKRVNPLRVASVLDNPSILLVADPELVETLPPSQRSNLSDWARSRDLEVIDSLTELQHELRQEAPDILYVFANWDRAGLRLKGKSITVQEMRDLLASAKQGNLDPLVLLQVCAPASAWEGWECFVTSAVNTLAGVITWEAPPSAALADRLGVLTLENFLRNTDLGQAVKAARAGADLAALAYSAFCPSHVKVAGDDGTDPDIPGPVPLPLPDYPYRPLLPFESEDRGLFTGREDDTVRCAGLLDEAATRGLIVHGAGGVGKSSFLRAGLVPHLETEAVGYLALRDRTPEDQDSAALPPDQQERAYPVVALRPGRDLLGQLAEALCAFCAQPFSYAAPTGETIHVDLLGMLTAFMDAPDLAYTAFPPAQASQAPSTAVSSVPLRATGASAERESTEVSAARLWRALERYPELLAGLLDQLTRRLPFELVLVLEQGEDLVLHESRSGGRRRQRDLESLDGLLRSAARCKVILAMRTEHIGRLMDHVPSGPERWRYFFLAELGADQMLRAVQLPTAAEPVPYSSEIPRQKYRFTFDDDLASRLVNDVVQAARDKQSSPLPLLQIACADLYDRMSKRQEEVITKAARKEQGRVDDLLSRFVSKLIKGLPITPTDRTALRELMESLYLRHTDGSLSRKLVPMRKVAETWKSSAPLETVVDAAAHEDLVEVNQMLVAGRPELFISLPQESLAQSAHEWDEDRKRQTFGRSRIVDTLWIMIPMLFLVAAITYTMTRRAAATSTSEDAATADQEQIAKALRAQLEFSRWSMYAGDLARAEQAWNNDNVLVARQLLLQQQPYKQADLRDFEWYYLWNKIQGKGPESAGHKGLITSVAISPDGATGASASLDGTIKLWNLLKGEENATLQAHAGPVLCVAFSRDGKTVASGGADKIIRLWDASAGGAKPAVVAKATRDLTGHTGEVRALVFGPSALYSGGADKQVITWDLASGKPAQIFKEHAAPVQALALAPDSKTMASADADAVVLLHDGVKTLQTIRAPSPVAALAFASDGKTLATGGAEKQANLERGMIRFWDPATAQETGKPLEHAWGVFSLAYVPKSGHLASAGKDNLIRVWDVSQGRQLSAYRGHIGWVASFAVSAAGSTLVSGSYDGTIKIWGSSPPESIAAHEGAAEAVLFTPDDKAVISGGRDGTVKFWDPGTGELLSKLAGLGGVTSLAYTAKESPARLAAGIWNEKNEGEVRLWEVVWDAKEGVKAKELPPLKGHTKGVTCLAFSPDGKTLASGSADQTAILWNAASGKQEAILKGHEGEVRCLAFSGEGDILMTGGADGEVRQWHAKDGTPFKPPLPVHAGGVNAVQYFFGVVGFITAGADHSTKFWVWNPGKQPEPDHQHRSHAEAVTSLASGPGGRFVVTGSMDRTVKILDTQVEESKPSATFGLERFTFRGQTPFRAVAVSANNQIVAAAGDDGTIHFWRAAAKGRKAE